VTAAEPRSWYSIADEAVKRVRNGHATHVDGAELERRIVADAHDIDARVRLVGFYLPARSPENDRRRAEHLVWLAEDRPDIALSGYGRIYDADAPGYEATRRAWLAAAAKPEADVRILENAASFLGFIRPEEAEPLFRRAAALEPENGRWHKLIADTLTKRAEEADDADERRRLARDAVEEFAIALTLADEDWVALGNRIDLVKAAVLAEAWDRARETAERVLVDNETCQRKFQYGDAIHEANIALGLAALADDDVTAAAEYLVRAGKTPGSPQLEYIGPDLDLARALLKRGERTAVLVYLTDCARLCERRADLVAGWRAAIERGEPIKLEHPDEHDT